MAYDFDSAETRDFSAYAYPAPGIDRELSAQYHPGVGGVDDDIPVLKEKENDKNVNNNDGKRLRRAGQVRSVFPDSWIWTETNIRYLTDTVKNMSVLLHFGFVPCLFILVDMLCISDKIIFIHIWRIQEGHMLPSRCNFFHFHEGSYKNFAR